MVVARTLEHHVGVLGTVLVVFGEVGELHVPGAGLLVLGIRAADREGGRRGIDASVERERADGLGARGTRLHQAHRDGAAPRGACLLIDDLSVLVGHGIAVLVEFCPVLIDACVRRALVAVGDGRGAGLGVDGRAHVEPHGVFRAVLVGEVDEEAVHAPVGAGQHPNLVFRIALDVGLEPTVHVLVALGIVARHAPGGKLLGKTLGIPAGQLFRDAGIGPTDRIARIVRIAVGSPVAVLVLGRMRFKQAPQGESDLYIFELVLVAAADPGLGGRRRNRIGTAVDERPVVIHTAVTRGARVFSDGRVGSGGTVHPVVVRLGVGALLHRTVVGARGVRHNGAAVQALIARGRVLAQRIDIGVAVGVVFGEGIVAKHLLELGTQVDALGTRGLVVRGADGELHKRAAGAHLSRTAPVGRAVVSIAPQRIGGGRTIGRIGIEPFLGARILGGARMGDGDGATAVGGIGPRAIRDGCRVVVPDLIGVFERAPGAVGSRGVVALLHQAVHVGRTVRVVQRQAHGEHAVAVGIPRGRDKAVVEHLRKLHVVRGAARGMQGLVRSELPRQLVGAAEIAVGIVEVAADIELEGKGHGLKQQDRLDLEVLSILLALGLGNGRRAKHLILVGSRAIGIDQGRILHRHGICAGDFVLDVVRDVLGIGRRPVVDGLARFLVSRDIGELLGGHLGGQLIARGGHIRTRSRIVDGHERGTVGLERIDVQIGFGLVGEVDAVGRERLLGRSPIERIVQAVLVARLQIGCARAIRAVVVSPARGELLRRGGTGHLVFDIALLGIVRIVGGAICKQGRRLGIRGALSREQTERRGKIALGRNRERCRARIAGCKGLQRPGLVVLLVTHQRGIDAHIQIDNGIDR